MNREQARPLNIAFLGYNATTTRKGFQMMIEENKDQIEKVTNGGCRALLKDGTMIVAILSDCNLRGYKFDQLILCDDERWKIYGHKAELIDDILSYNMGLSYVPDEFKVLKIDYFQ